METKCSVLSMLILSCLLGHGEQLELRREAGARDEHSGSLARKWDPSRRRQGSCFTSE